MTIANLRRDSRCSDDTSDPEIIRLPGSLPDSVSSGRQYVTDTGPSDTTVEASTWSEQDRTRPEKLLYESVGGQEPEPDVTLKEAEEEEEEEDGVPYDRGWAWMLVVGLFVNFLLISGYLKSSGILFVELLHRFHASTTHTALMFAIKSGVFSVCGLLVMNVLVGRFGSRPLMCFGAVLMALSAILASLADDLMLFILIHSVLLAISMGTVISPGEVLIGHYFKKRRSLALALAKCGASVGNMTIPPLVSFLLTQHGLQGTMLLFGALCLHSLPTSMLFRPTSYFAKRRSPVKGRDDDKPSTLPSLLCTKKRGPGMEVNAGGGDVSVKDPLMSRVPEGKARPQVQFDSASPADRAYSATSDSRLKLRGVTHGLHVPRRGLQSEWTHSNPELFPSSSSAFRQRTYSELPAKKQVLRQRSDETQAGSGKLGFLDAISHSSVVRYMSVSSLNVVSISLMSQVSVESQHSEEEENKGEERTKPCHRKLLDCLLWCPRNTFGVLDFSLFRSALFRLLLLYFTMSGIINITLDYLPAAASDQGVSDSQAALLITIIGALDLVCRLTCGFVADLRIVRVPTMIIIAFLIVAVATHFVRFMTSFEHFVALAVLQGLFGGVGNCLAPVLIIEFVGLENMGKGIGFCQLVSGISMACMYPFLGYIRDTTGSYAVVYHVIGVCILCAALLLCLEKPVKHLETRTRGKIASQPTIPPVEIVVQTEDKT